MIHGRRQHQRRRGHETEGGQQIAGESAGELRQQVRGRRRDDHGIGPAGELDVAHRGLGLLVPQIWSAPAGPDTAWNTVAETSCSRTAGHDDADLGARSRRRRTRSGLL